MIQLAICDDDKRDLTRTVELIKEWLYEPNKPEIKIRKFASPFLLLDAVSGGEAFDIFLLDILMPEMSGISLGEQLSNLLAEPLIVYLSSSTDYYSDAFRLFAFNYICLWTGSFCFRFLTKLPAALSNTGITYLF